MRLLFTSAQLPGHLDWGGYLATAAELVKRGHTVLWVSGKEVQSQVEKANIPFCCVNETGWRWPPPPPLAPDPNIDEQTLHRLRAERALDQWLDLDLVIPASENLIAVCRDFAPDVVVAENFVSAAAIAAEVVNVPFAVAGWPALEVSVNPKTEVISKMGRQRLQTMLKRFAIQGRNWTKQGPPALLSPHLHLTYWSKSWYSGLDFLPQTEHVGGLPPQAPSSKPGETHAQLLSTRSITAQPWVFITLGTSFTDDANFFVAASHTAEKVGALPIVALAQSAVPTDLAKSSVVFEKIDFDALLPHISAAIHHGGAGTTHALVRHAIPQIVVPHAADQMHQAHGVARSGVGVGVQPRNVTIAGLTHLLTEMLKETTPYQKCAKTLQAEFFALGGIASGAQRIEQIAKAQNVDVPYHA